MSLRAAFFKIYCFVGTYRTDLQEAYDLLAPCPRLARLFYPYTRPDSPTDYRVTMQSAAAVLCITNCDAYHRLSFERIILDSSTFLDSILRTVEEATHIYLIVRSENDLSRNPGDLGAFAFKVPDDPRIFVVFPHSVNVGAPFSSGCTD